MSAWAGPADHKANYTAPVGLYSAEQIAHALGQAKYVGREWKCLCPAHIDHNPSLGITEQDGKVLLTCRAGCSQDTVIRALQQRGLWPSAATSTGSGKAPRRPPGRAQTGAAPKSEEVWQPIVPPPADAPKPSERDLRCDQVHEYCGTDDRVLFYIRRIESDGSKAKLFLPLTYGRLNGKAGWHSRAPAEPRPLYRLNALSHADVSAPVLLVEGEKAAEAAQRLFPDMVAMTWAGGASATATADLSPLTDRDVILWPDADVPGRDAMAAISKRLPRARLLDTADLPAGFDAADLEQEGCEDLDAWLAARLKSKPDHPEIDPADCLPFRWGVEFQRVLDTQDFVEGLLTSTCLAVVYGDSNVGKSFWAIDLGLHIAGGIQWNGREVEQGIVLLISLEGGKMTDNRVIAARERLKLPPTVPFAVAQCPIDLRTNSVDADRVVNAIKLAISQCAGPLSVRLVIIDTMSRALNGGSEGAEDMSALLANADRIRHEVGVAILFVAHCGKDAARGIRGWSGIRAAIDVEIEIKRLDDNAGFVAEVTKQRDLPVGDRFGFTLDVVALGNNQRDKPVTTCVIAPVAPPTKEQPNPDRLTADQISLLRTCQNVLATTGRRGSPLSGLSNVPMESRKVLQNRLVEDGWLRVREDGLSDRLSSDGKSEPGISDVEHQRLWKALTTLKNRGIIGFNRVHFWDARAERMP